MVSSLYSESFCGQTLRKVYFFYMGLGGMTIFCLDCSDEARACLKTIATSISLAGIAPGLVAP